MQEDGSQGILLLIPKLSYKLSADEFDLLRLIFIVGLFSHELILHKIVLQQLIHMVRDRSRSQPELARQICLIRRLLS